MTLQKQVLEYYEWTDVEAFLCEKMEIPVDKFRNYHDIVGGDYKDFWHVWLFLVDDDVFLVDDDVSNYKMSDVWFDMLYDKEERAITKFGDWVKILFSAIEALHIEVDVDSINILYSW